MKEMERNKTNNEALLIKTYSHAVNTIKEAILNAQYEAARGVNSIQLMLYYGIGRYLSYNTRQGRWGTDAIGAISRMLKTDMPGLRSCLDFTVNKFKEILFCLFGVLFGIFALSVLANRPLFAANQEYKSTQKVFPTKL